MRRGQTRSLAQALVEASGGRSPRPPVGNLPDFALIDLPATDKLTGQLANIAQRLQAPLRVPEGPDGVNDESLPSGLSQRERNWLTSLRGRLERSLEEARERDRRLVEQARPAGCWCMGLGGRGEVARVLGEPIDPDRQVWEMTTTANLDVVVCREYCPCEDGARLSAEHVEALQGAVKAVEERKLHAALMAKWADVGLPQNSERYPTVDDFPTDDARQAHAVAAIKAWRPPRWLYLVGPTRRGKTTLAAALARHADQMGYSVRFRTMDQILERLKAAMDHEDEAVDDVLKPLLEVEFLVLDDLGAEAATRWAVGRILRMLDERLVKGLTTIITSNLDLYGHLESSLLGHIAAGGSDPDLKVQAGRIVARLKESSDVVLVDGPALTPTHAEVLPW